MRRERPPAARRRAPSHPDAAPRRAARRCTRPAPSRPLVRPFAAGELLLSGSDDYSIKLWRTALGPAGESGCIASLTGHEARVWCVVATDEHIYSCGADKTIIAWSMGEARRGTSTQVAHLTNHTDVVYSLLLAGGALFSSSADKTIRRYDTARHT